MNINYQSDFKIVERLMPDAPFRFTYYIGKDKGSVTAEYDGQSYSGCFVDGDRLIVPVDGGTLGIGNVRVKREYFLDDKAFVDGVCNLVSVEGTDIELGRVRTDSDIEANVEVGVPYKTFTFDDMTEEQKQEIADRVPTKEAERERAEAERVEAENKRVAAEKVRAAAEAARQATFTANEASRQSTFDTNEEARQATFNTNESKREAEFGAAIQSAKNNLIVVNDLTTGGEDKALSAEMGKELSGRLAELGQYVENPEYVRAYTDAEGRFLWGIKQDGSIEFAKGIPSPIKAYIDSLDRNNDEEVERINQLVIGLLADVKSLKETYYYISNPEWACAIVDAEEHILMGIKADGSYYIPNRDTYHVKSNPEYAKVVVDSEGHVLFGIKADGTCYIPKGISEEAKKGLIELTSRIAYFENVFSGVSNPEWIQVTTDSDGRILEGIRNDGKKYLPKQEMLENYNDVEGRTEMTLDADGKILSYRDGNGVMHETKMSISDRLSLGVGAMSDLQKALREGGFNVDNPIDWSNEKAITLPTPRYCAKVNIIVEGGLATTKTQNKKAILQFWDKSGNYFKKYIIDNAQGSSSMSYIEKNQGIDVFNDEAYEENCDITFGDWVAQDSFHLKCYYIDVFRGIANVGYNYCEEVIQYMNCRNNRIALDNSDITKENSTGDFAVDFGDGALCHPDGFPFEMYVNGEYYGLFAWNLKKHRKNYSMNKKDYTSALLDGIIDETTFFNGSIIDWTQFELRNPKDLVTMDGREYDADTNRNELIDETSAYYDANNEVHVNTAKIKEVVKRQASAIPLIIAEQDEDSARRIYNQYYDVESMMCFFIISNVIYNYDGFRKNWIWTIYNTIAAPSFYDLDSIFGRSWTGCNVVEGSDINILGTNLSLPTGQLVRLYKAELNTLYKSLRDKNLISVDTIMQYVHDWVHKVGLVEYKKNIDAWPSIPSYRKEKTENDGTYDGGMFDSPRRIELWLAERIKNLDSYFEYV